MTIKIEYNKKFDKIFQKLNSHNQKQILKQIKKIIENPLIGKLMKYNRKGTRELYISPYRISYQ